MSYLKNKLFSLATVALLMAFNVSYSQSRTEKIKAYIAKHKELAIEQMVRFGIPASVTLAQAIKESDFGTSELAKYTNNHFAIKCHSEWGGKNYLLDDDELDECFRAYNSVEESYLDHSMFLVSRTRYAFLFNFRSSDYYNWCIGLKKAGYATAWNYADELLLIIAAFDLDKLDKPEPMAAINLYEELKPTPLNEKDIIPNAENYYKPAGDLSLIIAVFEIDKLDKPEAMPIQNVYEDLMPQLNKDIIKNSKNYYTPKERAILAKIILNQAAATEQPLLVRRDGAEHAE